MGWHLSYKNWPQFVHKIWLVDWRTQSRNFWKNTMANTLQFFSIPKDPWDWYIYLHEWVIFMENVGKYTIHGSSGNEFTPWLVRMITSSKGSDILRVCLKNYEVPIGSIGQFTCCLVFYGKLVGTPGDSMWPFDSLVRGGVLKHPKKVTSRIAR